MIVRDNSKLYKQFFDKLNIALGYKGDQEISDINDYFMELYNIKEGVVNGTSGFDPYMLILPNESDEPIFAIDANTRQISVPSAFSTGVGVQGDDLAEVIYFSIDRYFDTTDLYDKEIFIQWEAPSGDRGLSIAVNKTLNLLPNKVVFGWAISKEMTTKAGSIKFAIRFYEREAQGESPKLIYSFSTLTSTVKINPALDFDIDTEDDVNAIGAIDKSALIYKMMRNSSASGLDAKAAAPTIDEKNCSPAFAPEKFDVGEKFIGRACFSEEDPEDTYGTISYAWYRSLNDNYKDSVKAEDSMLEYKAVEPNEVKYGYDAYYVEKNGSYELYTGALPADEGITVYKKYTSYTPTQAGYYYFEAKNSAGRGNEKTTNSKNWLIAFAEKPVINCENLLHVIMEGNKASLDPEVSVGDNGALTYQWYRRANELNSEFAIIDGQDKATLEATLEGYYKLKATNSKNNSTAEAESEQMRITMPASDIPDNSTWTYYSDGVVANPSRLSVKNGPITIKVAIGQLERSDNLKYQWSKSDDGDSYSNIEGATREELTVSLGGYYRVQVINEYNGDIKEATSSDFTVMQ